MRCAELEAQVTSLRAAVVIRTSIIDSQSGRIAELEAALEDERELVRSLHDRLGEMEQRLQAPAALPHRRRIGRSR